MGSRRFIRFPLIAAALAVVAISSVASAQSGPAEEFGTQANVVVPGSAYYPLNPARVLDTRFGVGGVAGPVGPGVSFALPVRGVAGVPADASAVVMNVTAAYASELSFVTVWPSGQSRPEASSLNPTPGLIAPNSVTSQIGADGNVAFFNAAGNVQLVADVVGYYKSISVPSPTLWTKSTAFPSTITAGSASTLIGTYSLPASNYQGTYSVSATLAAGATAECGLYGDYSGTLIAFTGSVRAVSNLSASAESTTISLSSAFAVSSFGGQGVLLRCAASGGQVTINPGSNLVAEQVNIVTL